MTPDTLDRAGRRAAAGLLDELDDLDTEAALAALLDGGAVAPAPDRAGDGGGRRRWLGAAAVVALVAGGAAAAVAWDRDGDRDVRTAEAPAIDPADYGPVIGRLVGQEDPGLVAEVHGPELLGAADEVAIVVRGAPPGRRYQLAQCVRPGMPQSNPASTCRSGDEVEIGDDGSGIVATRLPSRFMGTISQRPNDCRPDGCELQLGPVIEDDEPDQDQEAIRFVSTSDPWFTGDGSAPSPWIPLAFDPAAPAQGVPQLAVEPGDGGRTVVSGEGFAPGRLRLIAQGFEQEPTAPFTELSPTATAELAAVDVDASGSFSVEIDLPEVVDQPAVVDGEDAFPARQVACSSAPWACRIRPLWDGDRPTPTVDGVDALLAEPVPFPAS